MASGANADYVRAREILGDKLEEICAPFLKMPNTDQTRADLIQAIDNAVMVELARKGAASLIGGNPTLVIEPSDGVPGFMIVQFGTMDLSDMENSACLQLEIKTQRGMFGAVYETEAEARKVIKEMLRRIPRLVLDVRASTVGMQEKV